jgi:membrane protein DedA with SNARE-associated domain
MLLAIFMFLVGAALGQRFTVFVLLPAILVTLGVAIGLGIVRAQTPGTIALVTIAAIACLQIGYLLGLGMRQLVQSRASRLRSGSFADSSRARRPAH